MPERAGFRPWREAWTQALYGERGFYRREDGPRSHFETSANAPGGEVRILAEAVARLAARHGCRRVVDLGAGRGELVAALAVLVPGGVASSGSGPMAHDPDDVAVVEVTGVDVVARPAGLPSEVGWLVSPGGAALPEALDNLETTLVIAHEWLDVVPCDVLGLAGDGRLHVVEVDGRGVERLGGPPSDEALAWCEQWWPLPDAEPGERVEVGLARDAAWAGLLSRVRSGVVVAVDYGHVADARPPGGTLSAHRGGRLVPPVPDGSCDLTAHVAWDSLLAGSGGAMQTQRAALTGLGVDGRRPAAEPSHPAYLAELQRAAAAATLLDPGGLGGLGWLVCPVQRSDAAEAAHDAAIGQAEPPPARLEP
jgi:SAM-dependent MidA family methyltransferase